MITEDLPPNSEIRVHLHEREDETIFIGTGHGIETLGEREGSRARLKSVREGLLAVLALLERPLGGCPSSWWRRVPAIDRRRPRRRGGASGKTVQDQRDVA